MEGWYQITNIPLKNARETEIKLKHLFYALKDGRVEKVETKSVISDEYCERNFNIILSDLTNIYSTCTHLSLAGQEEITQLLLRNLYNNFYNYLISFFL